MPAPPPASDQPPVDAGDLALVDVVSNRVYPVILPVCRYGRDISNDIVLTGDKSLSRFHFQITLSNSEYFVEDAGSRNGTFLNGSPVTAPRRILNGDVVSAGMSRYRFVIKSEGAETAIEPINGDHQFKAEEEIIPAVTEERPKPAVSEAPTKPQPQLAVPEPPADLESKLLQEGQKLLNSAVEPDADEASIDKLLPGKEDELGDTASRFLKLAQQNKMAKEDSLAQPDPLDIARLDMPEPSARSVTSNHKRDWPSWCTEFSFSELDDMRSRTETLEAEISAKQVELDRLHSEMADVESLKNRLLATRDAELVEACAEVFRQIGWNVDANAGSNNELVLSKSDKAEAIVRIVCTEAQPKPAELATLVSSLSTFWCDHGIEPKGLLLVAMQTDGPPNERPQLSKDYADYASKKNVCLMSSVQLLAIYREAVLRSADIESIQSALLNASGQLAGFEVAAAAKA